MTLAWKWDLPRSKFLDEIFSLSPTLSYTITKKPKRIFAAQKSLKVPKLSNSLNERFLSSVLSDRVFFRFLSDWVFFRFLTDKILFRVFSDMVLFEFSMIDSSKGSLVIDSSLGLSVLFFRYASTFFMKRCYHFVIKNRCSVLHHIFKKTFVHT